MSDTLDYLNSESIARELIRKTRGCAFTWQQQTPDSFVATSFDDSTSVPVLWEFVLTSVNNQYTINIFKNKDEYTTVSSTALQELYDIVFALASNSSVKKKQTVLQFIQNRPDCITPIGDTVTLRPNTDFTDPDTGWLRVPANGYRYEKVRDAVAVHDGDATFIYDNTGTSVIEMGFTGVPFPPNGEPLTFNQIDVSIVVKNVSGSPTLDGELSIKIPGQSDWTQPFTSGGIDSSYGTVTWTWADTFTQQQVNHLRIKFNGIPGVNRVTAIEAVLTVA